MDLQWKLLSLGTALCKCHILTVFVFLLPCGCAPSPAKGQLPFPVPCPVPGVGEQGTLGWPGWVTDTVTPVQIPQAFPGSSCSGSPSDHGAAPCQGQTFPQGRQEGTDRPWPQQGSLAKGAQHGALLASKGLRPSPLQSR